MGDKVTEHRSEVPVKPEKKFSENDIAIKICEDVLDKKLTEDEVFEVEALFNTVLFEREFTKGDRKFHNLLTKFYLVNKYQKLVRLWFMMRYWDTTTKLYQGIDILIAALKGKTMTSLKKESSYSLTGAISRLQRAADMSTERDKMAGSFAGVLAGGDVNQFFNFGKMSEQEAEEARNMLLSGIMDIYEKSGADAALMAFVQEKLQKGSVVDAEAREIRTGAGEAREEAVRKRGKKAGILDEIKFGRNYDADDDGTGAIDIGEELAGTG